MKTVQVNYYKKCEENGWTFTSLNLNKVDVRSHLRHLVQQKKKGFVRLIEVVQPKK